MANRAPLTADTARSILTRTFGAFDGSPEREFGEITAFTVDDSGGVLAYDRDWGLKRFDREGEFIGWLATPGQGPGEVGCAHALAARRERVALDDRCNRRITLFRGDSLESSMPRPDGSFRYGEDALFFDPEGRLWVALMPLPARGASIEFPRPIAARLDADGALRDTIFAPARYAERCPILTESRYRAGFWDDKRERWYPKVKWAMGPGGSLAFGCPRSFELDVVRPGQPVLRIEKPWRPVETTADQRAFHERWWQPLPPLPELRPAYARIVLANDGRVWVWPEQPEEPSDFDEAAQAMTGRRHGWNAAVHGAFEVFDQDGRWLGAVRVPDMLPYSGYPTTHPVVIRGDTIWAVMLDSLDVQYVGRFQVDWPGG